MKLLRPISILVSWLMLTASATAQTPLLPPPAGPRQEGKEGSTQAEAIRGGQEARCRGNAETGSNACANCDRNARSRL